MLVEDLRRASHGHLERGSGPHAFRGSTALRDTGRRIGSSPQLELIQTAAEPTVYGDWIAAHGYGCTTWASAAHGPIHELIEASTISRPNGIRH